MAETNTSGKFLLFRSGIGNRLLAAGDVVEVIPMIALQRDPDDDMDPRFCGVFDYRGRIVPVFDFVSYQQGNIKNPDAFLLIVHGSRSMLALVAYDIDDLVDVAADSIDEVAPESGLPFAVARLGEQLVKIVNPDRFVSS